MGCMSDGPAEGASASGNADGRKEGPSIGRTEESSDGLLVEGAVGWNVGINEGCPVDGLKVGLTDGLFG